MYKSKADVEVGNYATYTTVYIKDKKDKYKYKIISSANSLQNPVEEGQKATITIIRQDLSGNPTSGTSSTVYISTSEGTAYEDDYEKINLRKITFGNEDTTKTIEISTKTDNIADDGEYFWVDLYKSKADAKKSDYHAYTTVYIKKKKVKMLLINTNMKLQVMQIQKIMQWKKVKTQQLLSLVKI